MSDVLELIPAPDVDSSSSLECHAQPCPHDAAYVVRLTCQPVEAGECHGFPTTALLCARHLQVLQQMLKTPFLNKDGIALHITATWTELL